MSVLCGSSPVESLLRGELYSGFPWSGQEGKGLRDGDRAANRKGLWAGVRILGEGSTVCSAQVDSAARPAAVSFPRRVPPMVHYFISVQKLTSWAEARARPKEVGAADDLDQGAAHVFCQGPDRDCFRLCRAVLCLLCGRRCVNP